VTDYSLLAIAGLSFDVDYGILHAEEGGMMKFESLDIRGTGSRGRLRFLDLPSLLQKVAFTMA
jgi:hypothetical protein